jgi:hypothetical protein
MQFAVYEAVKEGLGGYEAGHSSFISGFAGAVATAFNDAVMTPVDVIKQRLQVRLIATHWDRGEQWAFHTVG